MAVEYRKATKMRFMTSPYRSASSKSGPSSILFITRCVSAAGARFLVSQAFQNLR